MAKQKKDFAGDPGGLIGDAIWSAIKPIYKEAKRRERSAARAARKTYYAPEPKTSIKQIVFEVLPEAIGNAGVNFSARDLYYAVRPLAYAHYDWEDDKTLEHDYFAQKILTQYQEEHGPIVGMWRDPRGTLHEPHTGKSVPLGTREVAAYDFPDYVFDKVLYVEKEGELSKLRAAKLAERYDMAICSGKGQPTEAVRDLFARAEGGNYQLFVFHDADLDGYDIARVMGEATRRMPDHYVEVIDIGLTIEDALDMDLADEPFYRTKNISWELRSRLSGVARQYLYQRDPYRKGVSGRRFELNAILPDTRRIEYIERKLKEHGVRPKVIPPEKALKERREEMYREAVDEWVDEIIAEMINTDELKKKLADEFEARFKLEEAERWIKSGFKRDDTQSWRDALGSALQAAYERKHKSALADAVRDYIEDKINESP